MITPIPFVRSRAMILPISATASGSIPAKGSSSRMYFGEVTSARVISTRLLSPPDNEYALLSASWVRSSSARSCHSRSSLSSRLRASVSRMAMMFSLTVNFRKIDGSCGR